jgi:hypothetical protein
MRVGLIPAEQTGGDAAATEKGRLQADRAWYTGDVQAVHLCINFLESHSDERLELAEEGTQVGHEQLVILMARKGKRLVHEAEGEGVRFHNE